MALRLYAPMISGRMRERHNDVQRASQRRAADEPTRRTDYVRRGVSLLHIHNRNALLYAHQPCRSGMVIRYGRKRCASC